MKYTDNALNILTAKSYKGIGNAWIVKNLGNNESVESIVALLNKSTKEQPTTVEEFVQLKSKFESTILNKMSGFCDGFVALGDNDFPQHRGKVKDSERPVFLYYKGNIGLLDTANKNISVIGLLNPTEEIEMREQKLVAEFVRRGATIVSGLALGCDSISHREALNSNGKTIAILPSPLTSILPASNKGLAFQIVDEGGLLVTEYGNDFKSKMELSTRYKERDRLQALFCDTIVLAASYSQNSAKHWSHLYGQKLDSGARLAMGYAKDYNIPRAVMYDRGVDENNPMFDLCREIIKESHNLTIIGQDNYLDKVNAILSQEVRIERKVKAQTGFFD
jgi:DNA protecting protein dprA